MSFSISSPLARTPAAAVRRAWWRWAAAASVALSACGGGTSQYEPFVPGRVLVVGDELSALDSAGNKYGVNGRKTDDTGNDLRG